MYCPYSIPRTRAILNHIKLNQPPRHISTAQKELQKKQPLHPAGRSGCCLSLLLLFPHREGRAAADHHHRCSNSGNGAAGNAPAGSFPIPGRLGIGDFCLGFRSFLTFRRRFRRRRSLLNCGGSLRLHRIRRRLGCRLFFGLRTLRPRIHAGADQRHVAIRSGHHGLRCAEIHGGPR